MNENDLKTVAAGIPPSSTLASRILYFTQKPFEIFHLKGRSKSWNNKRELKCKITSRRRASYCIY